MLFESPSKNRSILKNTRVQLGNVSESQRVQRPSISGFFQASTPVQRSRQPCIIDLQLLQHLGS